MLEQPDEAAEILDRADQYSLAFEKVAGDSLRLLAKYSLKSDIRSKHHPPEFSHFFNEVTAANFGSRLLM